MLQEWYKEDTWCKGMSAQGERGQEVAWDSVDAVKFDLITAIRITYLPEKHDEIINLVKKNIAFIFSEKKENFQDYYKKEGKLHYVYPVYRFSDWASWKDIKKLLTVLDI